MRKNAKRRLLNRSFCEKSPRGAAGKSQAEQLAVGKVAREGDRRTFPECQERENELCSSDVKIRISDI